METSRSSSDVVPSTRAVRPASFSVAAPAHARTELGRGAKPLIRMQGNTTFLDPPEAGSAQAAAVAGRASERKTIPFTFDKSYWSAGPKDEPGYCSQQMLFDDLGRELLDHAFNGFNTSILACQCRAASARSAAGPADARVQTDRLVRESRIGRRMPACVCGPGSRVRVQYDGL
jgi:hypothetical protein